MSDNTDMPLDADPKEATATVTSEPQAPRKPAISEEELEKMFWEVFPGAAKGIYRTDAVIHFAQAILDRLITSGELIVRDELVVWLKKQRDDHSAAHGNSYTEECLAYDAVIDHISKKP